MSNDLRVLMEETLALERPAAAGPVMTTPAATPVPPSSPTPPLAPPAWIPPPDDD